MSSLQQRILEASQAFTALLPSLVPCLPRDPKERQATLHRAKKLIRKFGPLTLIITLLFAIKYFLLGIHINVHHIKANIQEQCDMQQTVKLSSSIGAKNERWTQHRMVGRGAYGFVQWSGHRISLSKIMAVGFGASVLRDSRSATTCTWHGADGTSIPGEPKVLYPLAKSDGHQYEPIILSCELSGKVTSYSGGHATLTLDKEHMVMYREPPDAHLSGYTAGANKATFCTFPVAEAVDGERIREWLDMHKVQGADHVIMYDAGGVDKEAVVKFEHYVKSGFLEIMPMREVVEFDLKSHGKIVAMHDCLYHSALTTNWVVFIDWDDILYLQSPRFLSILLEDHKDVPWMTYGCRVFSTKLCLATSAVPGSSRGFRGTEKGQVPFPYERMVYHWPHFLCPDDFKGDKNMCPGEGGMRYIIANPTKVILVSQNEVVDPAEGGLVLSADDVRHDRFEGIQKQGLSDKWCKETHGVDDKVEWWHKSEEVVVVAEDARKELVGKTKKQSRRRIL